MKTKISITVDQITLEKILIHVDKGRFRNTSHAFEFAVRKVLQEAGELK